MRIGYHASPQGHTQRSIDTFAAVPPAVCLWLAGNHQPSDATRYPDAWHLVRLPTPAVDEPVANYARAMERFIAPWRAIEATVAALYFVPGNEAEYADGNDVTVAWDLTQWLTAAPNYAAALHAMFPGIRLAAPALMTEHTNELTSDGGPHYLSGFDAITCHCYWQIQDEPGIRWHLGGGAYTHAVTIAAGDPVIVTEVGVVSQSGNYRDGNMDWSTRNRQLATWINEAAAAGVTAACMFVVDASPDFACFDIGPEAATEIRSLIAPPPIPVPPPVPVPPSTNAPLGFKARNPDAIKAMIRDGSGGGQSPFLSDNVVAALIQACETWNLDEAAMIAWTTSENNNATNISASLLGAHNGAGIKYVGQPRTHDGSTYHPPVVAPASEGGVPYGVFDTWADFFWVLARNIVTILPAAYTAGDLNRIAWYYTLGSAGLAHADAGEKHLKERLYEQFAAYPNDGPTPAPHYQIVTPVDCPVVQGSNGAFSHGGKVAGFFALDYGCAVGTPVRASADGVVLHAYWQDSNPISLRTGHSLYIAHDNGYATFSCHLSRFDVAEGDRVTQGQIIGLTGTPLDPGNGFGDGPHLHWEIWQGAWPNGVRVKMEDLEAAGIAGPWTGTPQEVTDMKVETSFDDAELVRLWNGPKTTAQIKKAPFNKDFGIPQAWAVELRAGRPLGFAVSGEEHDAASNRTVVYFSNGKITYFPADGSVKIN